MGGETYTQREDFFPYLLPGARGCQRLHPLASSPETPLISCVSLARQRFSALCLNLTAWFSPSGLLPVTHLLYPSALIVLSCLLIKMWHLVKTHEVTRNEPKIHGIFYITQRTFNYQPLSKIWMRHKVNFKVEFNMFHLRVFLLQDRLP